MPFYIYNYEMPQCSPNNPGLRQGIVEVELWVDDNACPENSFEKAFEKARAGQIKEAKEAIAKWPTANNGKIAYWFTKMLRKVEKLPYAPPVKYWKWGGYEAMGDKWD